MDVEDIAPSIQLQQLLALLSFFHVYNHSHMDGYTHEKMKRSDIFYSRGNVKMDLCPWNSLMLMSQHLEEAGFVKWSNGLLWGSLTASTGRQPPKRLGCYPTGSNMGIKPVANCICFLLVLLTNDHKLYGLKEHKFILFWRPEVQHEYGEFSSATPWYCCPYCCLSIYFVWPSSLQGP